jgi:NAD(P)-dependent dehydrogenase (short-subunit alcohol dehydrogenase family)
MPPTTSSQILRANLLDGVSIALARASGRSTLADTVRASCVELGARVSELELAVGVEDPAQRDAHVEQAVARVLGEAEQIDLLVLDCAGLLAAETSGERALMASMEASWSVTHAVVGSAFLGRQRGGRIVYLAPAVDRGQHARAACAGLENLARTLSIEWARHEITTVAVAPGTHTSDAELGALVGYLASPAGAYFSGCLLDLRGVSGRSDA